MDTLLKLLVAALSAPLWLPLARELREQWRAVLDEEPEARRRPGSWKAGPVRAPLPTENHDLVEVPFSPTPSKDWRFRSEPVTGLVPRSARTVRRAS